MGLGACHKSQDPGPAGFNSSRESDGSALKGISRGEGHGEWPAGVLPRNLRASESTETRTISRLQAGPLSSSEVRK